MDLVIPTGNNKGVNARRNMVLPRHVTTQIFFSFSSLVKTKELLDRDLVCCSES